MSSAASSLLPAPDLSDEPNLIDRLLLEQRQLRSSTAVDEFSRWHVDHHDEPMMAPRYRKLIPLDKPKPGQQLAFEVSLDTCSGCKACVAACHSLNGLDENETWRSVGFLHGAADGRPAMQTVTTACHHCAEPACAEGCPVMAYDKDPETGIVRHLDDQCIGCQYCILKCPYEVPKYSEARGIVRKCDMCHDRLAHGEAPACVQSCPNEAIRIVIVDTETTLQTTGTGTHLLPGTVDSSYTHPTTRYTTARTGTPLQPADAEAVRLECPHLPLVFMLTMTQTSLGMLGAAIVLLSSGIDFSRLTAAGAFCGLAGIGGSMLHLGKPLKAWRAFLGLRTSWLSREVILFGAFGPLAGLAAFLAFLPKLLPLLPPLPVPELSMLIGILPLLAGPVLAAALLSGVASVFCSVMVYVDTRRMLWTMPRTTLRFFGTSLLLGAAAGCLATFWTEGPSPTGTVLLAIAVAAVIFKAAGELLFLRHKNDPTDSPDRRSARLLLRSDALRKPFIARLALLAFGIALLAVPSLPVIAAGVLCLAAAEFTERYLFFRGVTAYRMTGIS
jgi:formate dehydrogenase iron-sulfur subunit